LRGLVNSRIGAIAPPARPLPKKKSGKNQKYKIIQLAKRNGKGDNDWKFYFGKDSGIKKRIIKKE
jgi:hypothetical protein